MKTDPPNEAIEAEIDKYVEQLGAARAARRATAETVVLQPKGAAPKLTYTVLQFCAEHNVSRTHFYALLNNGLGPRVMKLGVKTLISAEAAAEWRASLEGQFDVSKNVGVKAWATATNRDVANGEAPVRRKPGRPRKVEILKPS